MCDMNIPAIRGKIGNTVYYCANFSFQQINELVDRKVGNEIYTSKTLKEIGRASCRERV